MTLTPAFLDELRARTSLTDLVGKTVKLQRAGREMRGPCPFHQEKTPSFYVNDDKGFYHCFGCSAHGDAIRWMTEQRGLPFMDAVKELAAAAGLEVPAADPRAAARQERAKGLHEAMADAATWFSDQLHGVAGAEARAVLEKRGVTPETARAFALGFAPDSRGKLRGALKDYGDGPLVEAGLLIKVDGKDPYDRFRGRLMIPIRDPRGRPIAFGGRVIGEGEPKYLNSPDTPLFDKGRTLYNLDRAVPAARKSGRLFVVEGYMDVIALAQAGIAEAVAPLGTALTEAQIEHLWRVVDVPTLCFDGDTAGQKAALRAAHRALPMLTPGKSLSFVSLPNGQDPDDVIQQEGADGIERRFAEAQSFDERLWRSELAGLTNEGPDQRAAFEDRLRKLSLRIEDKTVQFAYQSFFRNQFRERFGWRKDSFEKLREAARDAQRQEGRGLAYAFHRAVLLGLMRHPVVVLNKLQTLHEVPFVDRYIRRWFDLLVEVVLENPSADESIIDKILQSTDVHPIESRCYQRDLAFSFFRRSSDFEVAVNDLQKVIDIMAEEHVTKKAAILADAVFKRDMTAENFDNQIRSHAAAATASSELYEWVELAREAA